MALSFPLALQGHPRRPLQGRGAREPPREDPRPGFGWLSWLGWLARVWLAFLRICVDFGLISVWILASASFWFDSGLA